ncbi:5'/3'-nucleotidase SurE [Chloroflexi bacterium CFX5]|nr:5'/3'-nucleotidase SurE [Anaerolineales bacterium]MDL1920665.1 5'/3'-nucleotidase SurE [Chloroflexi bacterium CFX5]NUQ59960.1 5'/3'-nucleotidase SurE [Anaerolineales bacterium]
MTKRKPHILLTNDDGIRSPGLWAAASELSKIGYVTVAAPREQSSGMGRSLPSTSSGVIKKEQVQVNGQTWDVYAVGGSPAQAVLHGVLEIVPHEPDLVVSGINYGENVGLGVTISGTVGAAMEAAGLGYRALAVSLETDPHFHLTHSEDVDFKAAAHFTARFARLLLNKKSFDGVDVLKVEVPRHATPETEWRLSSLSRLRYYKPTPPKRKSWDEPGPIGYEHDNNLPHEVKGTDVYVLRHEKMVAVTPINLDMTARVDFDAYDKFLRD